MMGIGKNIKLLQKELKSAGADRKVVRDWVKLYQKVSRNYPKVKGAYDAQRTQLEYLHNLLKHMESCFAGDGDIKNALKQDAALLKQVKEFAGHEFLVDKGNTEFILTFSRLKSMMASLKKVSEKDMLFLHSEIENLSDMIKEILENKVPNLHALTFFLMVQSESQLKDLPYEEKIRRVDIVYYQGFRKSIEVVLSQAMERANTPILSTNGDKPKEERIEYIMEEWIWK